MEQSGITPVAAMVQMQNGVVVMGMGRDILGVEQKQSETLGNTPAQSKSPIEVILDFQILDQNKNGEITVAEFIDGLRYNRQLASKFGLSDDVLDEGKARAKYELISGSVDNKHPETVNVILIYENCINCA